MGSLPLKVGARAHSAPAARERHPQGLPAPWALGPKPSALWGTVYCIRGLQVCGLVQQPEWTPGEQPNTVQGAAGILPLRTGALKAAAWGLATL